MGAIHLDCHCHTDVRMSPTDTTSHFKTAAKTALVHARDHLAVEPHPVFAMDISVYACALDVEKDSGRQVLQ